MNGKQPAVTDPVPTRRCGHLMKAYELSRYPDAVPDPFTRCGRPYGHKSTRHQSRSAYERELARKRLRRRMESQARLAKQALAA
jgi:hypothetical protein